MTDQDKSKQIVEAVLTGTPITINEVSDELAKAEVSTQSTDVVTTPAETDESVGKVKAATIRRLLILLIAIINEIFNTLGIYSSINVNEGVIDLISVGFVAGAALWCYWQNNSWSKEANYADAIMKALQEGGLSVSDILELLAAASKKKETKEDK